MCDYHRWVCLLVCWCLCAATSGRPDGLDPDGSRGERGVLQRRCYGIMEDVSLVSLITGLYHGLSPLHTSYTPLSFHTNTHTHTYTCILSLPSLSERLHSPPYRLKPALTVLAPLTHTLSRGHTTLWNNYSLNWQLINLKSIWPCQPNLEIESRGSRDTEAKNWVDGGMEGAEEEEAEREGGKWWTNVDLSLHQRRNHLQYLLVWVKITWDLFLCVCLCVQHYTLSDHCQLILLSWSFRC